MSNLSLSTPSTAPTTSKTTGIDGKTFNTAIAKAEGEFMCSADDLFDFLTNEVRERGAVVNGLTGAHVAHFLHCRPRFLCGRVTLRR